MNHEQNNFGGLSEYEGNLVVNLQVESKKPIPQDIELISTSFEEVAKAFPGMTETKLPETDGDNSGKNEYWLCETDKENRRRNVRELLIQKKSILVGAAHPLKSYEQFNTVQKSIEILETFKFITPLLLDSVLLSCVFELDFKGNHHEKILSTLFKESCFQQIMDAVDGVTTVFKPLMYILDKKDRSIRLIINIRPKTSMQEIESNEYDGDSIAPMCTIAKFSDFSPQDSLSALFKQLKERCLTFGKGPFIKYILEPLAASIEGEEQ